MPTLKRQTLRNQIKKWKKDIPEDKLPNVSSFYLHSGRRRWEVNEWKSREPDMYAIFRHEVVEWIRQRIMDAGLNGVPYYITTDEGKIVKRYKYISHAFLIWYAKFGLRMEEDKEEDMNVVKIEINTDNEGKHTLNEKENKDIRKDNKTK